MESSSPDVINLRFEKIEDYIVEEAITPELIFDWMVYRDFEGRGIYTLINEKMNGLDLVCTEWQEVIEDSECICSCYEEKVDERGA